MICNDFGPNKALLKVTVNYACRLRSAKTLANRPRTHFLHPSCKVGLKLQQAIRLTDNAVHPGLFQTEIVEEHLALFVGLQLDDIRFGGYGQMQHPCAFLRRHFGHLAHVVVAVLGRRLIHVAHVEHGLIRKQLIVRNPFRLFFAALKSTHRKALLQMLFQAVCHFHLPNRLFSARFGGFAHFIDALFQGLEVLELQFKVDGLLVAQRVDAAVDVHDVGVVKAA